MKGTMIIFLVAVFLLLVLAWLVQETDPEKQYGSRLSCMFWAWAGELQKVTAQAGQLFKLIQTEGVASYQGTVYDALDEQKKHMEYTKEQLFSADYKRREKYNRKVLG